MHGVAGSIFGTKAYFYWIRMLTGSSSAPRFVRVRRGEAKAWFYRNESSIDVYVRTADNKNDAAPICFRILLAHIQETK